MATGYVRDARLGEEDTIAGIQLETWRYAYRRMLPARVLDQLDEEWLASHWRTAITAPPSPRHRVLVAFEQAAETHLVGFAAAGPADAEAAAPDEPSPPDPAHTVAVTELLVLPRWQRRGHGSRLLAACVDHWRADGFTTAVVWAFEADNATRAFLSSTGWQPDGATRALDVDDLLVPQLRWHTLLTEEAADAGEAESSETNSEAE